VLRTPNNPNQSLFGTLTGGRHATNSKERMLFRGITVTTELCPTSTHAFRMCNTLRNTVWKGDGDGRLRNTELIMCRHNSSLAVMQNTGGFLGCGIRRDGEGKEGLDKRWSVLCILVSSVKRFRIGY